MEWAMTTHIVAPGDTLYGLALRYYGSPERWPDIYSANITVIYEAQQKGSARRELCRNHPENWIFPGTRLLIP